VSEREYEDVVRGLFEAWNSHRIADTADVFHDDVELDTSDLPQPDFSGFYRGREAMGTWTRTWLAAWQHFEAEPVWIASRGEQVVAWVHMRMIGKGSGVPVEIRGGWGFWFRDGKVSRVRLYADEQKARDSLGVEVARD
jgi:ketosteroid isomerase-like protein